MSHTASKQPFRNASCSLWGRVIMQLGGELLCSWAIIQNDRTPRKARHSCVRSRGRPRHVRHRATSHKPEKSMSPREENGSPGVQSECGSALQGLCVPHFEVRTRLDHTSAGKEAAPSSVPRSTHQLGSITPAQEKRRLHCSTLNTPHLPKL